MNQQFQEMQLLYLFLVSFQISKYKKSNMSHYNSILISCLFLSQYLSDSKKK